MRQLLLRSLNKSYRFIIRRLCRAAVRHRWSFWFWSMAGSLNRRVFWRLIRH